MADVDDREPKTETSAAPAPSRAETVTMHLARVVAALGQCACVAVTWQLWSARHAPPTLPIGPAITLPFAHVLIVTALLATVVPRAGSLLNALVIALAIAADQTRAQPTALCFAMVLLGTGWGPRAWPIARVFLGTMWLYAGVHKLLSAGWFTGTAPWLLVALTKTPSPMVSKWFPWVIAGGEALLGALALVPRTRRLAAAGGVLLHLGILYDLGPWGHKWNEAVWPWNAALALLSPLLFWPPARESLVRSVRSAHRATLAVCAALVIGPLLWHVGLYPPYFSHHLYSEDLPTSRWCSASNLCTDERANDEVYSALRVPLPPATSTIAQYFQARCAPGDRLEMTDPRRWFARRGQGRITVLCARR